MKKISLMFILIFLNINVWAIGSESDKDSSSSSDKKVDKEIKKWETQDSLGNKILILMQFLYDNVLIKLSVERVDGNNIKTNNLGVLLLPSGTALVAKIILENKDEVKPMYSFPLSFSGSFKDFLKIDKVELVTPDSTISYDMNQLFESDGTFKKEVKISNLPTGKTELIMTQKVVKE